MCKAETMAELPIPRLEELKEVQDKLDLSHALPIRAVRRGSQAKPAK